MSLENYKAALDDPSTAEHLESPIDSYIDAVFRELETNWANQDIGGVYDCLQAIQSINSNENSGILQRIGEYDVIQILISVIGSSEDIDGDISYEDYLFIGFYLLTSFIQGSPSSMSPPLSSRVVETIRIHFIDYSEAFQEYSLEILILILTDRSESRLKVDCLSIAKQAVTSCDSAQVQSLGVRLMSHCLPLQALPKESQFTLVDTLEFTFKERMYHCLSESLNVVSAVFQEDPRLINSSVEFYIDTALSYPTVSVICSGIRLLTLIYSTYNSDTIVLSEERLKLLSSFITPESQLLCSAVAQFTRVVITQHSELMESLIQFGFFDRFAEVATVLSMSTKCEIGMCVSACLRVANSEQIEHIIDLGLVALFMDVIQALPIAEQRDAIFSLDVGLTNCDALRETVAEAVSLHILEDLGENSALADTVQVIRRHL